VRDFIEGIVQRQREFFLGKKTWSIEFRKKSLERLRLNIKRLEPQILKALEQDLGKSAEEAYLTEIGLIYHEIDTHLKKVHQWAKPTSVRTPLFLLPSSFQIIPQPMGVALILAPWNYPFQLVINPLIGAVAAGCCALLKPSPMAPHINEVLLELIQSSFDPEHVSLILGNEDVYEPLMQVRFDVIFFTGSPRVGKIIMKAAAEYLTPVILELGGKNPCFVDQDADLKIAARRIVWGKCLNSGQTCIAPDYVIAHASIKEQLLQELVYAYEALYTNDNQGVRPQYFGKMITRDACERMQRLIQQGQVVYGGLIDVSNRYVQFTILDQVNMDSELMSTEIFGPLLPVISFQNLEEAIEEVNTKERPLASYYFGSNKRSAYFSENILAGGIGINDTIMQVANSNLPFGGVGTSGMGAYHGKNSFDCFSHMKGVVKTPTWIDLPFKYPPFKHLNWVKKLIG
jgi:aldehyde dehydrogenase (NAD+)